MEANLQARTLGLYCARTQSNMKQARHIHHVKMVLKNEHGAIGCSIWRAFALDIPSPACNLNTPD